MNLRPANVEDVVRQSVHVCAAQLAAREVTLTSDSNPPRALVDGIWLQKTFCNLLENAAKYSPPGSPVDIKIAADEGSIAVHITDRGVGIAISEQALVFEKFYRGRTQLHRRPGTGMGLAISRAIVEAHRGTIRVSSAPGQGSTFTVELPVWHGAGKSSQA
jgi:two-component system sensor histidine kinase KdpD